MNSDSDAAPGPATQGPPDQVAVHVLDGDVFWNAFGLLNPNYVRDDLQQHATASATALTMAVTTARQLSHRAGNPGDLMRFLRNDGLMTGFSPALKPTPVFCYRDFQQIGAAFAALAAVKAFLDVHARFLSTAISPGNTLQGFNKQGNEPGGKFLKWLEAQNHYARRDDQAALFRRHLTEWLSDAITWRDHLVHFGHLRGFQFMHVIGDREINAISVDMVQPARMPNGETLPAYARRIEDSLGTLLRTSVELTPQAQDPEKVHFQGGGPGPGIGW